MAMESRLGPRVNIDIKISSEISKSDDQNITLADGNQFEANAFDISVVGIGMITKFFLPKGLLIEIDIDGAPFDLAENVKIKCEVRHCASIKNRRYKCGIKFLDLSAEYKKAILQLISKYESKSKSHLKLHT